ncbi:cysteine desulfurase [Candidatus Woesearchaeota archaeon]|nr:cysteine desulfurase [Candidatus Woesearchaeota archaeon]
MQRKQLKQIYLDYAAATPVDKAVLKEMQKYQDIYVNPSSTHSPGKEASNCLEYCREKIAKIINCQTSEIIFTSGGTESNNLALQGMKKSVKIIITTKIEHISILKTVEYLQKEELINKKLILVILDVNRKGEIDLQQLERLITPECLVSIGYVNNELGVVHNIAKISEIIHNKKIEFGVNSIFFHTDACQAEFQQLDVQKLGVDILTLNSSKMYGPKGAGLLYVRKTTPLEPLLFGGIQENQRRAGTENLQAIAGFTKAVEINEEIKKKESKKIIKIYNYFQKQLKQIKNITINSQPSHILSVTIDGCYSQTILNYLNQENIYASAGSACATGNHEPSHVLKAIGLKDEEAMNTIRFSLGRDTTKKEINVVVNKLRKIVDGLREIMK